MKYLAGVRHYDKRINIVSVSEVTDWKDIFGIIKNAYPSARTILVSLPKPILFETIESKDAA